MGAFNLGTVLALIFIGAVAAATAEEAHQCGQRQSIVKELIFNGYKAFSGAWPWHGAMFYRKNEAAKIEYVCGVTVLSKQFVITATHCTIDKQTKQYRIAHRVYVQLGTTNLNSPERHVQQHDVVEIFRHGDFDRDTFENNIALMKLYTAVTYNEYVQPICLWQGDVSLSKVVSKIGYAVGWGYHDEDYGLSEELKEATMPIVSREECIKSDPIVYNKYTFEKETFCAGYRNGTTVSLGDGGGGFYLRDGNHWVLRGIFSVRKLDGDTGNTDHLSYAIFTDVANYVDWLKQYVTTTTSYSTRPETLSVTEKYTSVALKRKDYTDTPKCGQKQQNVVKKLIFNGLKALPGAWPWHGAMFHRLKAGQTTYACGVTIITERFVVTAAHCTFDQQDEQRLPAERVYIRVGLTNLDSPEPYAQQHDVTRIIRHGEYEKETFENDIALIKLFTEITYNDYVQPICLWKGDTNLKNVVSQIGYTVGWGYNEKFGLPKNLNEATMPIVSRKECINSDPNYYRKVYIEPKTFCAGFRNGTTAAPGDSGGGLFLPRGDSWVLRGIISNTKSDPNTLLVDPKSFVVFTDASVYLDWINDHVNPKASNKPCVGYYCHLENLGLLNN